MKVSSYFTSIKKTRYSFEIIPYLINDNILEIFNNINNLMEFNPPFINVTSHKDDKKQKRLKKLRRPGTIAICGAIQYQYNIDAIPHFLCKFLTKDIIEDFLIKLKYLGINNLIILRGDTSKATRKTYLYKYSIELIREFILTNNKISLYQFLKKSNFSNFCIGIASYPEKHFEAPNLEEDIFRLSEKIKAGSCFLITQMFFNNNQYFDFLEKIRFAGFQIPIIPGIKPFSSITQLKSIPSNFYIKIPTIILNRILKYKKDIWIIGIDWAIQQSIEIKEIGIWIIHFYTMNKSENIYQIIIEIIENIKYNYLFYK